MIDQMWHFIQPEQVITILVALSAFATVLTVAAPYMQGDRLRSRMKTVATERDRLKAAHRASLAVGEGRLREKPRAGLLTQLVEGLNLRQLMQAEGSQFARLRRCFSAFSCSSIRRRFLPTGYRRPCAWPQP